MDAGARILGSARGLALVVVIAAGSSAAFGCEPRPKAEAQPPAASDDTTTRDPLACRPRVDVRVIGEDGLAIEASTLALYGAESTLEAQPEDDTPASLEAPGGGHYLLVVAAPDHTPATVALALTCTATELEVVLPPAHEGHPSSAPRAKRRMLAGAPQTGEVLALHARVDQCPHDAIADRRAAIAERSAAWAAVHWQYDWPRVWSALAEEAEAETSELVAAARWMAWLACDAKGTLHTPGRDNHIQRVIGAVPPESPLWSWSSKSIRTTAELLPPAIVDAYLDEVDARNRDPSVRAAALHWRLEDAEQRGDTEAVATLFSRLRTELPKTEYGSYATLHDPDRGTAPGKTMPAFSVTGELGGEPVQITNEALRGQPYLLDIWATWCRPCVRGLPELHRVHAESGLAIVSASEEERDVIDTFRAEQQPMPWHHVYGEQARTLRRSLKTVTTMPTLVLVGPDGRILASSPRLTAENLDAILAETR